MDKITNPRFSHSLLDHTLVTCANADGAGCIRLCSFPGSTSFIGSEFDKLLDGLTGCDETSCEDTVRIGRIDG